MKISYDWLSEYVDHDLPPERLAEVLTMGGLEVDEMETIGQSYDRVVVGRVASVRSHPNADRLVLCMVDVGQSDLLQVACGAPNVAENQLVPVALEGATVQVPDRDDPNAYVPLTIERTKLRGETSEGMVCAEDELGMSDDHSGIMVLDNGAAVGQSFAEYLRRRQLPVHDTIFNIDLTPNRSDAASHIGVARDAAALTSTALEEPQVTLPEPGGQAAEEITIDIQDPDGCRRYTAVLVRNVTVKESPRWLQQRLKSIGLQPRNNIVDITNFIMHECGQPLHAFDLDRMAGPAVIVRRTRGKQTFVTLDDVERELPDNTLMICDAERPVAIAGIMGGQNSEVGNDTQHVLIESAYFDPGTIRQTAKALQLNTDSSYRFERGVDPQRQAWAAARAAELMVELAGGTIVSGMVDASPNPIRETTIELRPKRVETVLGIEIDADRIVSYLQAIGGQVTPAENERLTCIAPSFRPDLKREIDLIEEVARLYGYNNIPERGRTQIPNVVPAPDTPRRLRKRIRGRLAGLGFREIYTNSMLRQEVAERFADDLLGAFEGETTVVETLNPISREMAALRPTLLPGMLEVMAHNQHHGMEELRFMEFGHIFQETDRSDTIIPGYEEHQSMILGMSGPAQRAAWDREVKTSDFFDLKGVIETLLEMLHLDNLETVTYSDPTSTTSYRLVLQAGGDHLGVIARLRDELAEERDLKNPVFFAELSLDNLLAQAVPHWERSYHPVSRFPRVNRDLAIVVRRGQAAGDLLKTIEREGAPLLQNIDVFDVYEGEHVPEGHKSIGFSLQFGAGHTLVDEEVDEQVNAIMKALKKKYDATLRE